MAVQADPQYFAIPRPPQDVFRKDIKKFQKLDTIGSALLKEHYPDESEGGGILLYYENHAYPHKGYPFPEAVHAINAPKKFFKATAGFIQRHKILTALALIAVVLNGKRVLRSFHATYVYEFLHSHLAQWFLDPIRYCTSARELRRAGNVLANRRTGWVKEFFEQLTEVITMIFEYDNAWRYRMQDILGELDKEALAKNPGKEVVRLVEMGSGRERSWADTRTRQRVFGRALRFILFVSPSFRRLLREYVEELDLSKIKMDVSDLYYNYVRPDYDAGGIPMEQRLILRGNIDKVYQLKVAAMKEKMKTDEQTKDTSK